MRRNYVFAFPNVHKGIFSCYAKTRNLKCKQKKSEKL